MSTAFTEAVHAVIDGDEESLTTLLKRNPELVHHRSESSHAATLLHYVAANGVEKELQRSPKNAPTIARILLEAGAEVDALASIYEGPPANGTTLCLTVTSIHPRLAGVQNGLVDALVDYGARTNGIEDDGSPLGCALLFGYTAAAERLVARGARVDNIIYAAGLGRTDDVRAMLANGTGLEAIARRTDDRAGRYSFPIPRDADVCEVALIVAAMHNRVETVRALLDSGLDVDAAPFCGQTALHFAAQLGRRDVVTELLVRNADPTLIETQMNQTAAQWAREGGHPDIAEKLRR